MEHGIVKDWNDMERIWQYIYSKDQLQTFSEEVCIFQKFCLFNSAVFGENPKYCYSLGCGIGVMQKL